MPDWKREIERRLARGRIDPAAEYDLSEELAQHLEDRYQDLLSRGTNEGTARSAVLAELERMEDLPRSLSGLRREPRHEAVPAGSTTSGGFLLDLARDLRYGWRVMRKTPVLTFFAVLSLGIGIGANTTVFTIINTVLLHPLPAVEEPSRLVVLFQTGAKGAKLPFSYLNFQDYQRQQQCFRTIAAFTGPQVMTRHGSSGPERMFAEFVSQQYFDALGLRPAAGRFFRAEEAGQPGSALVAILSYNAWQSRYGGSPEAIGATLEMNNVAYTIVGVAPKGFLDVSAIFGPDAWLPYTMSERALPGEFANAFSDRAKPIFHVAGRLETGLAMPQAQAQLATVAAALAQAYPQANEGYGVSVRPISDELFNNVGGSGALAFGSAVLLAIVALILGIACSNVANLLLARAATRRQEVAVRLAVGANRGRLVRQLLTESVLLSVVSLAVGLALGYAGCRGVWWFVPAEVTQNMIAPRLDGSVLLYSAIVSLLTAFLFGLTPALRASRTDVAGVLKEETRTAGRGRRAVNLSNVLLVGQVAFSMVCLIVAALFFRSIQRAYTIDPGFQTSHLALLMMNPSQAGYGETRVKDFYRAARERVATLPGVASVSWGSGLPFWRNASGSVAIEGMELRKKADMITSVEVTVDTDYFRTMGVSLIEGREFTEADDEGALPVAMINQTLAEQHWPGGRALGHRFQFTGDPTWRQVVGVVKTTNYTTLGEAPQSCVYLPAKQKFSGGMTLYVRTEGDPSGVLAGVQREIRMLDGNIQLGDIRTGRMLVQQVLWAPTIGVALLGVFGSLALILASVGLYGVMAYSVTQRRREIGVRSALGASRAEVFRLVLREGMVLVCGGILLGLAAGFGLGSLMGRMLIGIGPGDPVSLAGASLVLMVVAWMACYLPARSATRIDPMTALRES